MSTQRERDVRVAIYELLESSGVFDRVYRGTLPGVGGEPTGMTRTASIEPSGTVLAGQGDGIEGVIRATASVAIVLVARDDDPTMRDDAAEMLLNTTAAALNGRSLGGGSLPGSTRIRSWAWRKATPPERRIEATLEFQYLVEPWDGFDLSE
jgi:hypothetical protein